MNKIHNDLLEISKAGIIENKFGGGNAGAALGGYYTAQAIDRLVLAIDRLAARPINVTVQLPQQSVVSRKPRTASKNATTEATQERKES